MDWSTPGSSVHGILQARIWEWVTSPSSRNLPNPGIEPMSLASPALVGGFFTTSATWEAPSSFTNNQKTVPRDSCKCRTLKLQTQIRKLTYRHNHLFLFLSFPFHKLNLYIFIVKMSWRVTHDWGIMKDVRFQLKTIFKGTTSTMDILQNDQFYMPWHLLLSQRKKTCLPFFYFLIDICVSTQKWISHSH